MQHVYDCDSAGSNTEFRTDCKAKDETTDEYAMLMHNCTIKRHQH